jgi:hypothetical protein
MSSFLVSILPAIRFTRSRLFRSLSILVFTSALSGALLAQTDPNATGAGNATDPSAANANGRGRRNQNGGANGGGRGNFDPAQMQQQMLAALRDQFGVTDDSEWKIISDKITAVSELNRATRGGFGGLRGGGGNRGGRGGAVANPEQDALRQAITDKLPDAEIKSRLARLREVRKANEEKLTKAQDDLRGVLSVRQEAVAVMAGLLP